MKEDKRNEAEAQKYHPMNTNMMNTKQNKSEEVERIRQKKFNKER